MSRPTRRRLALLFTTGLLVAACGDDGDDAAPATGVLPLLGVEGEVPERPALAVKVDNTEQGRPQIGLAQADVVYEEMVEGGLTRLLVVYHSKDPDAVGPVRSARSTDIPLLGELGRPLFAWSGANPTFAAAVEAADIVDVGMAAAPDAYERADDRSAPYDLVADPEQLREAGDGEGDQDLPPQLFEYRGEGEALTGPGVEEMVSLQMTSDQLSTSIVWEWDDDDGVWERTQDGSPLEDGEGERITAANVVVRATEYEDSGVRDSVGAVVPEAVLEGEGDVLLLSDGQAQPGRWQQPSSGAETVYTDLDGGPLQLAPGTTWIEVLPPGAAPLG